MGEHTGPAEQKPQQPREDTPAPAATACGLFKESDYLPFMAGVFLLGGLIVFPLTYGMQMKMEYLTALPWSLASCGVFLAAFRRNGTISWWRFVPAVAVLIIAGQMYHQQTGRPAFAAGGIVGFLAVMVCGYVGVGVGRLVRPKQP